VTGGAAAASFTLTQAEQAQHFAADLKGLLRNLR
jgi:hypothetical protein